MRKEGFAGGVEASQNGLPREGAVRDKDGNKHTAKSEIKILMQDKTGLFNFA